MTVLEAKDRLGGRMFTKSHGDGFIEFAAQGIHGAENKNSVFKFATDEGLLGSPPEIIETINGMDFYFVMTYLFIFLTFKYLLYRYATRSLLFKLRQKVQQADIPESSIKIFQKFLHSLGC